MAHVKYAQNAPARLSIIVCKKSLDGVR